MPGTKSRLSATLRSPRARRFARVGAVGVALLVAAVASCRDAPTAPSAAVPVSAAPALDVSPPPTTAPPPVPGTFTTTLTPTSSLENVGPVGFGEYDRRMLVEVRVNGLLDRFNGPTASWRYEDYSSPLVPRPIIDKRGWPAGQWDAAGTSNYMVGCSGNVVLNGGTWGFSTFCRSHPRAVQEIWADTTALAGAFTVTWRKGPLEMLYGCDGYGDPGPCYTFQGSFTVTVTPVARNLSLVAVPNVVDAGVPVTFTASGNSPGGQVPTIQSWSWVPDSGVGRTPACAMSTALVCTVPVYETGTMYVRGIMFDQTTEQASARVAVRDTVPCPTGDPILDDPAVRQGLKQVWNASNPEAPSDSNRIEHGAWIRLGSNGSLFVDPFPSSWAATGCGIDVPPETRPPSDAVAWVHTHGWTRGEKMTACRRLKVGNVELPFNYSGDPSDDDQQAAGVWSAIGSYLMDKDQIRKYDSRIPAGVNLGSYPRCFH